MRFFRVLRRQETSFFLRSFAFPALFAAAIAVLSPQTARADCSPNNPPDGTTVVCTGDDTNGYTTGADNLDVTVLPDATVTGGGLNVIGLNGNFNTVTNNGTITAPDGRGIHAESNSTIINNGTISTGVLFGGDGIQVQGPRNTITNNGTISTTANNASGINLSDADNTVINSGSILTAGNGATGINVSSSDSAVTNSGLIQVTGNSNAIRFGSSNSTLNLLSGSVIIGGLNFSSANNTLTVGNGLSVALTFNNQLPATIEAYGAPYAVSGNQVAVVDPTALAMQDEMLADLTSGIFNSIHARLAGTGGSSSAGAGMQLGMSPMMQLGGGSMMQLGMQDESPSVESDTGGVWAQAFGGARSEDAGQPTVGSETRYFGGLAGIDGRLMPGIMIGAFGGASEADLEVDFDSQDIDATSYFGGAYASLQQSGFFASLMVTAGRTDYDSARRVANNAVATGLETATASYDGTFVSPELTVGASMSLGGVALEPSARVRYAKLSLGGYSETGAADNLTVRGRDVSLWLGRLQLAMPMSSEAGTLAPRIGIEAWSSDNDSVSAVLLGQAISFNPGGDDDEVTGFLGMTATANLGYGATGFVDGEIHAGENGIARTEARGGVRVSF